MALGLRGAMRRRDLIALAGGAAFLPLAAPPQQGGMRATGVLGAPVADCPDRGGAGFVDSLARPGGNATGFVAFEFSLAGKWLELLKLIAPSVTRAAVIRDPAIPAGIGQWGAIQTAAPSFGVEVSPINVR